jgi:hypothetical protein
LIKLYSQSKKSFQFPLLFYQGNCTVTIENSWCLLYGDLVLFPFLYLQQDTTLFCGFLGFGDFDDGPSPWGFNSSWGSGGGGPGLRGNLGGRGGGLTLNLNMNSGGFGGLGMGRGGRAGGGAGGGNWSSNGTGLGGGGGGGGHCIHMRGLPFRATQADIADVRPHILFVTITLCIVFVRLYFSFTFNHMTRNTICDPNCFTRVLVVVSCVFVPPVTFEPVDGFSCNTVVKASLSSSWITKTGNQHILVYSVTIQHSSNHDASRSCPELKKA